MSDTSRIPSFLGGLVVLSIAGVLLGVGSFLAVASPVSRESLPALAGAAFFLLVGFPLWMAGWRLFLGDVRRTDGRLVSPLAWMGLGVWIGSLGYLAAAQSPDSLRQAPYLWGLAGLLFLWGATRKSRPRLST